MLESYDDLKQTLFSLLALSSSVQMLTGASGGGGGGGGGKGVWSLLPPELVILTLK